jgi:putative Holliday junction resolvase
MASNLPPNNTYILGLDVGDARIGVAVAGSIARLPRPLKQIENNPDVWENIKRIVDQEDAARVVVGLPRGQNGQETEQTQKVREFAKQLQNHIDCPVDFADESLSTVRAGETLKNQKHLDISEDSVAACYILEEFFNTQGAAV